MIFRFDIKIIRGAYLGRKKVTRTLEIPGARTLEDLCITILDSVDFDFDHLYEFRIRGQSYEGQPYGGGRQVRTKLYSLKLKKGETFDLWYDFGDDWIFSIKVADILEGSGNAVKVISRKGSVDQYPDYDEEEGYFAEDTDYAEDDDETVPPEVSQDPGEYDYTPPDALFEAAFRYKKTKLWKKITGDEPFYIRFTDGAEAVVSIMGMDGSHCAISVYSAEEGYRSYYEVETRERGCGRSQYLENEEGLMQDCLQIIFDNKEYLLPREEENARAYAAKKGIRFSGANAFPHFSRFKPAKYPWHPENEQEEQYLLEAAEAAIAVAEAMKKKKARELGFQTMNPFLREIPFVCRQDGKWALCGMHDLPDLPPVVYVKPQPSKDRLAALKKNRKKSVLQARIILMPTPVRGENGNAPFFLYTLMCYDPGNKMVFPPPTGRDLQKNGTEMIDGLIDFLIPLKIKPSVIQVEDRRTQAFLEPMAKEIGAKLQLLPEIEELDEVLEDFIYSMGGDRYEDGYESEEIPSMEEMEKEFDEFTDMLEQIADMPDHIVKMMPPEFIEHTKFMLDLGIVPDSLKRKVKKKLGLK